MATITIKNPINGFTTQIDESKMSQYQPPNTSVAWVKVGGGSSAPPSGSSSSGSSSGSSSPIPPDTETQNNTPYYGTIQDLANQGLQVSGGQVYSNGKVVGSYGGITPPGGTNSGNSPTPTTPIPATPTSTTSTPSPKNSEIASGLDINYKGTLNESEIHKLYQAFFGRKATGGHVGRGVFNGEVGAWMRSPVSALITQLQNDYKGASGHTYDGSPIKEGQTMSENDRAKQPPQNVTGSTDPVYIPDEAALQQRRDELAKAGIPQSEWSKYIVKMPGSDKLYFVDPKNAPTVPDNTQPYKDSTPGQQEIDPNIDPWDHTDEARYMTEEEVRKAFTGMGYEPSQADITYWTQKPISEITVLYDNLYKRKQKQIEQGAEQGQDIGQIHMRGDQALVMFSDDPDGPGPMSTSTVWLIDKNTKEIRPFMSAEAFNKYYEGVTTLADEWQKGTIASLPTTVLNNPNSSLYQFKLLPDTQGIQSDGRIPSADGPSEESMGELYGKEYNPEAQKTAFSILDNWLGLVKDTPDSGVDASMIDKILKDDTQMAFYINALAYGEYSPVDIYKDIKRKSLVEAGRSDLANVKLIHETMGASAYFATPEGQGARSNPDFSPPDQLADLDTSMFNLSIFNLPDEAFQALVQPIDWDSPEAKEEAAAIKSAYHDVLMKQLEAQTEQDKAIADYEYNMFKTELEKTFGIKLSDNVNQAWSQINSLTSGYTQAGLGDSGIMREAIDQELKAVRKNDEQMRESKLTSEEEAKRKYFLNSASPEEIAALSDAQKKAWGLTPSQDIINFLSVENLMDTYGLSEEEARNYRNLTLDENGSYRSTLYSNLYSNKYGVQMAKESHQRDQLYNQKLREEEKKYAELMESGNLSSGYLGDTTISAGEKQTPSLPGSITTTPGAATSSSTTETPASPTLSGDPAWDAFKTANPQKDWSGYVKLSPGYDQSAYTDVQGGTGFTALYGKPTGTTSGAAATGGKATLYGPSGTPEVVDIGSQRASLLQSQGWGLTPGSYKAPTTTSNTPSTQPAASTFSDPAWDAHKAKYADRDWSGYQKLEAGYDKNLYTDIQGGTGFKSLYGLPK